MMNCTHNYYASMQNCICCVKQINVLSIYLSILEIFHEGRLDRMGLRSARAAGWPTGTQTAGRTGRGPSPLTRWSVESQRWPLAVFFYFFTSEKWYFLHFWPLWLFDPVSIFHFANLGQVKKVGRKVNLKLFAANFPWPLRSGCSGSWMVHNYFKFSCINEIHIALAKRSNFAWQHLTSQKKKVVHNSLKSCTAWGKKISLDQL